ncbi:hypothetical protein [Botrimarina hoheduenensis]|nr:hypothetical protein [Botrimarina hoheduenensis]
MVFFYDPATGNVSLDTSNTRSGYAYSWHLDLPPNSPYGLLEENVVWLTSSQLKTQLQRQVGEASLTSPFSGYFTVGNLLVPGIDEAIWNTLFTSIGSSGYVDLIGQGASAPAEFVYGQPDRPFDNRWDIIDPDTLAWATQATLRYHAATGELVIDTTGPQSGHIATFTLESDGAFLAEAFNRFIEVPLTIANDSTLFIAADAIEPGLHSLGRVIEAGLSLAEVEALLTEASFIGRAGFGGGSFDLETDGVAFAISYIAIPEPATAILCLASAGCLAGRRWVA